MKAYEYCKNAATTMEQRGKENGYGNAKEERIAKQIAAVFNALTGRDLTEQEAWTFLICLKLVRQHRKHREDNIVDLVAYAALLGESYMTVHDEIQIDTTAAQYDRLKYGGAFPPGKTTVVLTGEDGSKILMTPEDFRNMEKTLVRSALK
ncbi:hypothetical protein P9630_gp55 [Escherichia phage BF9]|uniref:DUF6378 domain-containing protein n=1 Tax=Escherichia phage BF9 TaxID=2835936 RepID=A0AAE7V8B5_9CAUD|nr:hypothetical protein P9630_gp55 [Escherichia phage BF9]QXL91330.1 hypothetical protein [Escherichia phage BF9]